MMNQISCVRWTWWASVECSSKVNLQLSGCEMAQAQYLPVFWEYGFTNLTYWKIINNVADPRLKLTLFHFRSCSDKPTWDKFAAVWLNAWRLELFARWNDLRVHREVQQRRGAGCIAMQIPAVNDSRTVQLSLSGAFRRSLRTLLSWDVQTYSVRACIWAAVAFVRACVEQGFVWRISGLKIPFPTQRIGSPNVLLRPAT